MTPNDQFHVHGEGQGNICPITVDSEGTENESANGPCRSNAFFETVEIMIDTVAPEVSLECDCYLVLLI